MHRTLDTYAEDKNTNLNEKKVKKHRFQRIPVSQRVSLKVNRVFSKLRVCLFISCEKRGRRPYCAFFYDSFTKCFMNFLLRATDFFSRRVMLYNISLTIYLPLLKLLYKN